MRGIGVLALVLVLVSLWIGSYLLKRGAAGFAIGIPASATKVLRYDWASVSDRGLFALHGPLFWLDQRFFGQSDVHLVIDHRP